MFTKKERKEPMTTPRPEAQEITEKILGPCSCAEAFKIRNLIDPMCMWHEFHHELTAAITAERAVADTRRREVEGLRKELEEMRESNRVNYFNWRKSEVQLDEARADKSRLEEVVQNLQSVKSEGIFFEAELKRREDKIATLEAERERMLELLKLSDSALELCRQEMRDRGNLKIWNSLSAPGRIKEFLAALSNDSAEADNV